MKKMTLLTILLVFLVILISNCATTHTQQVTWGLANDRPQWATSIVNEIYGSQWMRRGAGSAKDLWFIYANPRNEKQELLYFEGSELALQFVLAFTKYEIVDILKKNYEGNLVFFLGEVRERKK